jgi:hypothetical protein
VQQEQVRRFPERPHDDSTPGEFTACTSLMVLSKKDFDSGRARTLLCAYMAICIAQDVLGPS